MRIYFFIVAIFCLSFISCDNDKKKDFAFYKVPFENHSVKVYLKDGKPFFQKYFEKEKEIKHIDSIMLDSMYSYQKNKLVAKGKWKTAENKKLIHTGGTKLFYGDSIYLVEYIDYDTINDINIINSQKLYVNNQLDSANSYYYNVYDVGKDSSVLEIKTIYRNDRKRASYLIVLDKEKKIDSIALKQGKNLFPEEYFTSPYQYQVKTYYLNKSGNRTSTIMEINPKY